ncbi:MAG: bifunctional 5,10-methylenetetrahydrofolate dehydrogenase/5,10-methenyltetrahydrofolate cyclohydrolase [Candidatus Poribacteria bacterium]|nr:bifunctional 5,10-methylenetetrahydrofolate dehydrogenase/5,10-methenyltetrahydrofolate cyclohydrolase [Candidatus Poribacteria bacterium]MDE0505080.1 bifunctional 5,10-methylenetetrahydrofolate dehydrogenase/5,10-methenyltetrahydrofolate cyclohydrolase [Candidatus Poribacteria bacterium]
MPAEIIDGSQIAKSIRSQIRRQVKKLKFTPGLVVVQVGDDPASTIYVTNKERDCKRVNFHSEVYKLPSNTSQAEIIDQVQLLNEREDVHGIIVQMPLPTGIDGQAVIDAISPEKDADGLSPVNLGNLLINRERVTPCTPTGVIRLIESTGVAVEGKRAVCLGRSSLVGKPVGLMLLNRNATVTYCHTRTRNLAEEIRQAEILVVAAGKPGIVTAPMVSEGTVVIDVGISRVNGRAAGDVDYESVRNVAGFITPVPGGVGPMTRAMLLENTLKLATA